MMRWIDMTLIKHTGALGSSPEVCLEGLYTIEAKIFFTFCYEFNFAIYGFFNPDFAEITITLVNYDV